MSSTLKVNCLLDSSILSLNRNLRESSGFLVPSCGSSWFSNWLRNGGGEGKTQPKYERHCATGYGTQMEWQGVEGSHLHHTILCLLATRNWPALPHHIPLHEGPAAQQAQKHGTHPPRTQTFDTKGWVKQSHPLSCLWQAFIRLTKILAHSQELFPLQLCRPAIYPADKGPGLGAILHFSFSITLSTPRKLVSLILNLPISLQLSHIPFQASITPDLI